MDDTSIRPVDRIEKIMDTYGDMLFRLCLVTLGDAGDAEDAVQETMIRYMHKAPVFENEGHEKAWLITVASNRCRDILRFRKRHPLAEITDIGQRRQEESDSGIMDALMTLPEKFRTVLILYYVEEYSTDEIARVIGKTVSAVKMRLQKGRRLLREAYERSI